MFNTAIQKWFKCGFFMLLTFLMTEGMVAQNIKKQKQKLTKEQKDSIAATKKVHFAGIPIVSYDRSIGAVFGLLGLMTFKYNKKDTISPSSRLGVVGVWSTNNTWGAMAFVDNYFKEDKWRVSAFGGYFSFKFQFFLNAPIPSGGIFLDYATNQYFGNVDVTRNIVDRFYLGLHTTIWYAQTTVIDSVEFEAKWLNSIGFSSQYDTRDNQNYPVDGWNIELDDDHYFEFLENENYFYRIKLMLNNYTSIGPKALFASRLYTDIAFGDVPFEAQSIVGRDDLRGYTDGKYRGNQLYAAQTEYRLMFVERWGFVAFGGLATAFNEFEDFTWERLLPAVGLGFRFRMIKSEKINIGIDGAVGKDDWGIYFRIREAF